MSPWLPRIHNPKPRYNPNAYNNNNVFNTTHNFNFANSLAQFSPLFDQVNNILEQFNVFDSNEKGEKGVIDAEEAKSAKGSIFFVEEGMTKQEFMNKNALIWEAIHPNENNLPGYIRPNLSNSVSNVVKRMIENGEFDAKKDMIMEKAAYLNKETLELVKSKLSPEEQEQVQKEWEHFNNALSVTPQENEMNAEAAEDTKKAMQETERKFIIDRAKKNGVELSEEEIQDLSNEDLNKLVNAKISKQKTEQTIKDNAKNMTPKFGLE